MSFHIPFPKKTGRLAAAVVAIALGLTAPGALAETQEKGVAEEGPGQRVSAPTPAAGDKSVGGQQGELTGQIVYQMLLGEIALRRNQPVVALAAYAELARSTRDPRIVQRAVELAALGRQHELELELARIWVEIAPNSMRARQMLVAGLVATGRVPEAEPHIAFVLEKDPEHVGLILMRLASSVAVSSSKKNMAAMMDRLAARYPGVPEAHFVGAFAALIAGERPRALEEIAKARQQRPAWEQAALLNAQMLEESGDSAGALKELRGFLDRYPKAKELRLQYAKALGREKRFSEAREQFLQLDKEGPANADVTHALAVLALQLSDLDDAEARFKSLLEGHEGNGDTLRVALGQIAEMRKKPEEALQWYSGVEKGPQYLDARLKSSLLLSRIKGPDEALKLLRATKGAGPAEEVQIALAEAQLLREAGRIEEALKGLEVALAKSPEQSELLYESALLLEKKGKLDVMETRLRKLIRLHPEFPHGYNALGYSFAERGINLVEAETLIRKAVELAPDDPFIQDSLGWVQFRKGDAEGARRTLRSALDKRADPEIAAHLGEVLWTLGEKDEARAVWAKALQAAPESEPLKSVMKKFRGDSGK